MSVILGISALDKDAAAALVVDGRIVSAVAEERLTRARIGYERDTGIPWVSHGPRTPAGPAAWPHTPRLRIRGDDVP